MRKPVWVVLVALIAAPALLSRGNKPDVTGKWELDLKKSENLPASFAHVDSYTFDVVQSGDTLTVNAGLIEAAATETGTIP